MKYPTPGEYQEAVQIRAFTDPDLQEAEPDTEALGLPVAVTGAFAVVFPVRVRGERRAVKCFLTHDPGRRERYDAVSKYLAGVGHPHTAPFEYQAEGIHVHGRALPVLEMDWVDGISIARFIEANLDRTDRLRSLRTRWRAMIRTLEDAGIAHGDLQHGNILVDDDVNLRLVDLDAMYVPTLRSKQSPEIGHRNYQHPERDETDFGPRMDRFSALVIDTAVLGCIHIPDLWPRYANGENLLFKASDFLDPDASTLLGELRSAEERALRKQAKWLRWACHGEPENTPSLDEIEALEPDPAPRIDDRVLESGRWWLGGRRGRRRAEAAAHRRRSASEKWFAPVTAGIAMVSAALFAAGLVAAAASVLSAAAVVGGAWTAWAYRRLPAVRRRRRLAKEEAYFEGLVDALAAELSRLESARERFAEQMTEQYDRRMAELEEEALHDRLKHHFIGEARGFDGITHKAVVRLKLAGIRTAYQATPERVGDILQLSDESKAKIGRWRSSLVAEYAAEIPTELSPAEERRVKRSIDVRLDEMEAEIARIRLKIRVQEDEREQLRARMTETPPVKLLDYVLFLLRLKPAS